jgi:predicted hotdog family 3-hydroxylacyl-ACP dehydratase
MTSGQALAALIPHAGSMCLLDAVESWDETRVSCRSASHRRPDHPLRRDGRLPSVHLIEYAAQATAVHGGLVAGSGAAPLRYLAAVRECDLHVSRFDDVPGDLCIEAERLLVMGNNVLYRFRIEDGGRALAEGRLTIAAPAGSPS